jgi:soluble lytic murein transglycosylase-like protein
MIVRPVLLRLLNQVFRPLASPILCGVLLFSQQLARADIWGYIDDQGVAHFAAERLDARYELFSRSGQSLQAGLTAPGAGGALRPVAVPTVPPKLIAFFEVSPSYKQVKHLLREAAHDYRIDYELLQALIATESGFAASAVSPKGAVGLMQIMPATAQRYGVAGDRKTPVEQKLADPRTNIRVGARYLRDLIAMFPGQLELALAAYNAGEGAVLRAGSRVPNYRETQSYVRTVLQLYAVLKPPTPLRVRMELAGGAAGRSNMLAAVLPVTVQNSSLTETD